jgi:hypothetical protein
VTEPAPTHFGRCRARLERAIGQACQGADGWPAAVAASVRAALALAASDPDAGRTLTAGAGRRGPDDEGFAELVDHLAALLGRDAPPRHARLPDARTVIVRIARQVNLELESGRGEDCEAIASDLTFLALMPYLGFAEARRWSQPTAVP